MAGNEVLILIRAVDRASSVLQGVGGATGKLGKEMKGLAVEALAASAIVTASALAIKAAYDFSKEGAQITRLRETGTRLAASWGVDMTEAVAKIKAASLDTITTTQAVLQVNRLLLLGITRDSDQMAKLVEISVLRGRAMGLTAQDAFDRITLGIGRLSTRILDDIGIVIDGETAYANFAKSIGKTADELTEAEKRIALTNAIIEEGNILLKNSGGLAEDQATSFEQLQTTTTDLTNSWKELTSPVMSQMAEGLNILIQKSLFFQVTMELMELFSLRLAQGLKGARQEVLNLSLALATGSFTRNAREAGSNISRPTGRTFRGGGGIDLAGQLHRALVDAEIAFNRQMEDIQIDFARTLRDIDIRANRDKEDSARNHDKRLIGIERDYQKTIDNIQERFERSRLAALIDRDARALFEAEQARDDDMEDATESRDEANQAEEEDYQERLADIDRRQEEERADAQLHLEDMRADALRDYEQRKADAIRQNAEMASQASGFGETMKKITKVTADEIAAIERKRRDDTLAHDREWWQERLNMATVEAEKLKNIITSAYGDTCFVSGTLITMADGSSKPIESVSVGDTVLSWDILAGTAVPAKVGLTFVHIPGERQIVCINGILWATPEHPLYSGRQWKKVEDLNECDGLSVLSGTGIESIGVKSLVYSLHTGPVYNIHVDNENHNYFANSILAHNKTAGELPDTGGDKGGKDEGGDTGAKEEGTGKDIGNGTDGGDTVYNPGGGTSAASVAGGTVRVVLDVRGSGELAALIRNTVSGTVSSLVERS